MRWFLLGVVGLCMTVLGVTENEAVMVRNEVIHGTEQIVELIELEKYTKEEVYFMANCVEAEAGNQGYEGKRLVASVILNRVDHDKYPNTIEGVIKQRGQFASYTDGGMKKWKPKEETIQVCWDEIKDRTENGFLFFRTTPFESDCYRHKDHYFN